MGGVAGGGTVTPRWQIIIVSQPSRRRFLQQLLAMLGYPRRDGVGVVLFEADPHRTIGENRTLARLVATGDYISFFDDDDVPAPDFVPSILPLLDGVDQVGFRLQCYIDGTPFARTLHTLAAKGWHDDGETYWRDISHLTPMRRELALLEPFEGRHGEDERWARAMRRRGVVKTERVVDLDGPPMYHYLMRPRKNDRRDWAAGYRVDLIRHLYPDLAIDLRVKA